MARRASPRTYSGGLTRGWRMRGEGRGFQFGHPVVSGAKSVDRVRHETAGACRREKALAKLYCIPFGVSARIQLSTRTIAVSQYGANEARH